MKMLVQIVSLEDIYIITHASLQVISLNDIFISPLEDMYARLEQSLKPTIMR